MRFRSSARLLAACALAACLSAHAATQGGANAFNPGIGFVMQGSYGSYASTAGNRQIPGFLLGDDAGLSPQGFSLGESELDLASNIDNLFYGFGALSFHDDHGESSVEVELAYLQSTSLPGGFTVTAGKFFSDFGYQNSRHSHVWDFVDQPLVYEAMMNNQYSDPGVRVTWLAPTDSYLLFGAEAFSGDNFPAGGAAHSGNGANTLFVKMSRDVNDSSTWYAGLSWMSARSMNRPSLGSDPADPDTNVADSGPLFTGTSNIAGADFVWKWSPHGNFYQKNFIFQAEYLHRNESGQLGASPCGTSPSCFGLRSGYRDSANGWYVQGTYQWMPRWRVGLRYDRLNSDNTLNGVYQPAVLLGNGFSPKRYSVMVDFSNTEFSRFRLQFNRDQSGVTAHNEIFFQYIVAMGAHPAHTF
ncbi:MAG TPA: porin [Gammaproteobacteria bacterium]|nr:porin [Gammaproteobacteria bacterium]